MPNRAAIALPRGRMAIRPWSGLGRMALALVIVVLASTGPAFAASWLVLVVDRSGSIDDDELSLQRQAYISVLRDERVAVSLQNTRVSIIEFDNDAQVVVPWTSATQAAAEYAAWRPLAPRGGTGIGRALSLALKMLDAKQGERVVDISGDGRENRDSTLLEHARQAAIVSAVEINGLVLNEQEHVGLKRYYREKVANGFVIGIDDMADFYAALRRKILRETKVSIRQTE